MRKFIRLIVFLIIILFIIILIIFFNNQFGNSSKKGEAIVEKINNNYEFINIDFNINDESYWKGGPICSYEGEIYTYLWKENIKSINDVNYNSLEEIETYKLIKVNIKDEKILYEDYIKEYSFEELGEVSSNSENNVFILNSDNYLYVYDFEGKEISKINLLGENVFDDDEEIFYGYQFNGMEHFQKGEFVYALTEFKNSSTEKDTPSNVYTVQKYNWLTGKYISGYQLENFEKVNQFGEFICGYDGDEILVSDLEGNIVKEIYLSEETIINNRELLFYTNDELYYLDEKGLYVSYKNEKGFEMLLETSDIFDSSNPEYFFKDMFVDEKNNIYFLFIGDISKHFLILNKK